MTKDSVRPQPPSTRPPGFDEVTYRRVLERSPNPVFVVDARGDVVVWNRSCERVFGGAATEIVGQPWLSLVEPADRARAQALVDDVFARATSHELELAWIARTGASTPMLTRVYPAVDASEVVVGCVVANVDLTAHREAEAHERAIEAARCDAERALASARTRWKLLIEEANDLIFGVDARGRIEFVNRASCRLLGLEADALVGRSPIDFAPDEVRPALAERLSRVLASAEADDVEGLLELEVEIVGADGARAPVELRGRREFEDGVLCGLFFIGRELGERRRAEAERLSLERAVQHAQKLESLGVLAGGIAHDFNNLLVAILGNVEIVLDELAADAPSREPLLDVEQAARRAAELTRQMLAYSGRGAFVIRPTDVSALALEMRRLLEVTVPKKIRFHTDLRPRLPLVRADATQLRQVVMNLITNAAEAIGEGGGDLWLETRFEPFVDRAPRLRVPSRPPPDGSYVVVEVRDTGAGMDDATLARIFDPFFTTKFTGRGLGLASVLGIVRGHEGCVEVDAREGGGTIFRVLLRPMTETSVVEIEPSPRDERPSARMRADAGTVLLVDDEAGVRAVTKRALERLGYRVVTAIDGEEALATFSAAPSRFRLALLDLTMPKLDGVETMRLLRELRPGLPVVLSTGFADAELRARVTGERATWFLGKPYPIEELEQVLAEAARA